MLWVVSSLSIDVSIVFHVVSRQCMSPRDAYTSDVPSEQLSAALEIEHTFSWLCVSLFVSVCLLYVP